MTPKTYANAETIANLATEFDMQAYEVAAFLDLGTDYSEVDVIDDATASEYREILALGAAQAGERA